MGVDGGFEGFGDEVVFATRENGVIEMHLTHYRKRFRIYRLLVLFKTLNYTVTFSFKRILVFISKWGRPNQQFYLKAIILINLLSLQGWIRGIVIVSRSVQLI